MRLHRVLIMIILLMSLCSCSLPIYIAKESLNDKVLYTYQEGKSIHDLNDIDIYRLGRQVGKLSFVGRMVTFTFLSGKKIELYKEQQYSGVDKITQSFDDKIIRVYHWQSGFTTKHRITELYLDNFTVKSYRIKEK